MSNAEQFDEEQIEAMIVFAELIMKAYGAKQDLQDFAERGLATLGFIDKRIWSDIGQMYASRVCITYRDENVSPTKTIYTSKAILIGA